jgi:glycosyltransferase involved in cell wall biosynthesis
MRILWLNWRDIRNPDSGGAEVLTHEIANRLAKKGHKVTLFVASFEGSNKQENIDCVNIVREGGKFTVYEKAKNYYKNNKDNFDLLVDEINVKPFLTPKFVKEIPIVALIHQVSPEQFTYELPFPIGIVGRYLLEKKWLSYYKDVSTVTVSESTRKSLAELGFRRVSVIKEGLSISPLKEPGKKEDKPTITFLGRLKKHKLPDHAILAFKKIKEQLPNSQMNVIGDGYWLEKLKHMKVKDVTFHGHISNKDKYDILSRSHLVLVPAIREGWGLVVVESNAMGVPVIAYTVPGLVDSVQNGTNGILVKPNTPDELAKAAVSLLNDSSRLKKLTETSIEYSKQFDWDTTTQQFEKVLLEKMSR